MTRETELLIEAASTAWRPRDPDARLRAHPAWHDLDAAGRVVLFDETVASRALEKSLDSRDLSPTARAVLSRITRLAT
jgi:hypothetical protein